MKKFELGKVYEQLSGGVVYAEFVPQCIGEDKAFGTWKSMNRVGDECETCVRHVCLEDKGYPRYREKPPEPQSLELFVNIYKGEGGKIFHGGSVYLSEENANKMAMSYYNSTKRKHVGVAHITFVEPKE